MQDRIIDMLSNGWIEKKNSSYIGNTFVNQQGREYVVTSYFHRKEDNKKMLSILFLESGYETLSTHTHVKNGLVVDRLSPNIAGVGCIGYASTKDNHKEYGVWYNMIERCYNKNNSSYGRYGGKGVTVCSRWLRFDYFLEDFTRIDGYDEEAFKCSELQLDKDLKQYDLPYEQRVYSLETCTLVSPLVNAQFVAPVKKGRKIVVTNIETSQELEFKSISQFAREFNYPRRKVSTYFSSGKAFENWVVKGENK